MARSWGFIGVNYGVLNIMLSMYGVQLENIDKHLWGTGDKIWDLKIDSFLLTFDLFGFIISSRLFMPEREIHAANHISLTLEIR